MEYSMQIKSFNIHFQVDIMPCWIPALACLSCLDQGTEYKLLLSCRTILPSHYGKRQLSIYQNCLVALKLQG